MSVLDGGRGLRKAGQGWAGRLVGRLVSPPVGRLGGRMAMLGSVALLLAGTGPLAAQPTPLSVSSSAFEDGGTIPLQYTAYGENRSPAISWSGAPEGTRSFVLIMHDRDAPMPGGFVHWVVYNIPGSATGLPEGLPAEAVIDAPSGLAGTHQGLSEMRTLGYYGPRPQQGDGPHHYVFTVYALDRPPDLAPGLGRNQVLSAVRDQVIGQGILTGVYEREQGTGRFEIDDPPPPVGGALINQAGRDGVTVRAVRVNEPIEIDGVLDEPFYRNVPPITELVQGVPVEDGEPSERTEVWIGFDDENVYVAARVWDSAGPDGWIANEMRRDAAQLRSNDHFAVFFDTFYDRRNAVGFSGTPIGGFSDFQITNEGNPNMDWNPVWETRSALFEGGWSIEMAIPFKSLRYRPGREQVWGIQIRRSILRRNEWIFLRALPLAVGGGGTSGTFRVSMYGTLVGIEAPPPSRNLEIKPYGIAGFRTDLAADPQLSNDGYADAGLDVKYGITENLTADFTYNTDFAQVEVDEQQVNLTRFSLFFPEKREFFLEGRGIFDFGVSGGGGGGGGGGAAPTLFYSRTIGLQGGQAVPIVGGGRVTGKVGSFDVGLVGIRTGQAPSVGAESTNFSVVRLRRDIFARSSVGVLYQNRSKSVTGQGSNQAWGVDGLFGLTDDLSVLAYFARTETEGLSGLDASFRGQLSYNADVWGGSVDHLVVGADFNPEIGFVRRKDLRRTSASGRFSPRPASISWIRQLTFQSNVSYLENERSGLVESRDWGGQFNAQLENGDQLSVGYTNSYENLVTDARISGATIPAGRYSFPDVRASYRLGPQRCHSANLSVRRGDYFGGTIRSAGLGGGRIEVTPQISIEPSLSFNWIDLPAAAVPGRYDQHVAVTRVTYTLTPRAYVSGLVQYNSRGRSASGNFRLRWEWAPGSELFLVYTEDRDTDVLEGWSELSNRGFVIKVNRLLRI